MIYKTGKILYYFIFTALLGILKASTYDTPWALPDICYEWRQSLKHSNVSTQTYTYEESIDSADEFEEEDSVSGQLDVSTEVEDVIYVTNDNSNDDSTLISQPKKKSPQKKKKGSPKRKKKRPNHGASDAELQPQQAILSVASEPKPITLHALTHQAYSMINVNFLDSRIDQLEEKVDRSSGYVRTILYRLDEESNIITRLTNSGSIHLLRIKDSGIELTQADRIFSLKNKRIDILLRNGNEIHPLYEEGWSEDDWLNSINDEGISLIEKVVSCFQKRLLPPYRQLNVSEVRQQFPQEKGLIRNTYFSIQPIKGENVIVRVYQNRCQAMTQQLRPAQKLAFDKFKAFHEACPIMLVKTQEDLVFTQKEDPFKFDD